MTRRAVPGAIGQCRRCRVTVVWARTAASPTGAGGKAMPLDPLEDPKGNVAVRAVTPRSAVARVLGKDETHDRYSEVLAMPHAATCAPTLAGTTPPPTLPPNVPSLDAHRAKKRSRP